MGTEGVNNLAELCVLRVSGRNILFVREEIHLGISSLAKNINKKKKRKLQLGNRIWCI